MLRHTLKFLAALLMVFITSVTLKAEETTYRLDVGDFSELQVIDPINVIHRCNADSAGTAVFTTTSEVVKAIMFTNNKGKLKIERNLDVPLSPIHFPTITVYSKFISSAENFSDSTIYIETPTPGASFKALLQGNGTIRVNNLHTTQTSAKIETGKGDIIMNGVTQSIKLNNVGTGRIDAGDLRASEGTVTIVGTGLVECYVTKELYVKGMGSGKVYVIGDPKIKKRAIGSIKVINVDETSL